MCISLYIWLVYYIIIIIKVNGKSHE